MNRAQQLYDIESAAKLLSVSYYTLFRRVAKVLKITDPLPPGKTIRALPLFLNPEASKPKWRIPEEEVVRVANLAKR